MLKSEGFKMFRGVMRITPKTNMFKPFEVYGTWLYRPDTGCWYCDGQSFTEDIVMIIRDDTNDK
jgi:hypothetical protein